MSSTKRFFDEQLMPLAAELQRNGVPLFPLGFDAECTSYFHQRPKRPTSRQDFEIDDKDLARACPSWTPGSERLAPALESLARELHQDAEEDREVSPFLYVMF